MDYDMNETSSTGLEGRIAAAISYIPIVGIIFYIMEKKSRYVKYHAAFSIILLVLDVIAGFVLGLVTTVLGVIPFLGVIFGALTNLVIYAAYLIALIYSAVMAYQGQPNRIPVIGKYAQQMSQKL